MTASTKRLIVTLVGVAGLLTANVAFAKNNGNGGNNGNHNNGNGGFKMSFGGNPQKTSNFTSSSFKKCDSHSCYKPSYDSHCYSNYSCYSNYCYPTYGCYSYYPSCVYPVYSSLSYEPIVSTCNITVIPAVEASRMKVAVGSTLMLNGQAFGDKGGVARLRISGLSLPIEVIEWTPSAVKVRLPQVELTGVTLADIEVVRPDGSLASKTAVELIAMPQQVALGQ